MKLGRRELVRGGSQLLGLAALGCSSPPNPAPAADVRLRPLSSLPVTELPWLRLRITKPGAVPTARGVGVEIERGQA